MKVYVAKVLVEDVNCNTCSVEVFADKDEARKWAKEELDIYASEYDGEVVEEYDHRMTMASGDNYVTIEIEEHEVK